MMIFCTCFPLCQPCPEGFQEEIMAALMIIAYSFGDIVLNLPYFMCMKKAKLVPALNQPWPTKTW